jgi:predicted dehydrogenase
VPCDVGWHTLKEYGGGVLIEQGAHEADLLMYFMGDVESVSAEAALFTPTRNLIPRKERLSKYSEHRVEHVTSTGSTFTLGQEDTAFSLIRFKSGAIRQHTLINASQGYGVSVNTIHGRVGTMVLHPARSGRSPAVRLEEGGEQIDGPALLDLLPHWGT